MKKIFKRISLTIAALALLSFTAIGVTGTVSATSSMDMIAVGANVKDSVCNGLNSSIEDGCDDGETNLNSVWDWIGTITGWLLTAVGVVCVIFIIIGGVKYSTSGGDADKVKSAKNTLLYALIGLGVALLAGVITSLVTNILTDGTLFS
jgi:hypothetical protein